MVDDTDLNDICDVKDAKIKELLEQVDCRTKFHNMIVHDLRHPATSIKQSADLAHKAIVITKKQNLKKMMKFKSIKN